MPDQRSGDDELLTPDLARARRDLVEAIEGSGATSEDGDPPLVKPGDGSFTFELRFNGAPVPLDGSEVNELAPDDFHPFLERHRLAAEAGDFDTLLSAELAKGGPAKASARVRAVGRAGADKTAPQ